MKPRFFGLFKPAANTPPSVQLAQQLEQAHALHKSGDFEGSGKLYREILASRPEVPDVYYRYANLLKDQGAHEAAVVNYDLAIGLKSNYIQAYCNRAVVLGFMNRPIEALDSYDRALAIDPSDAITQCNRAVLLLGLNDKDRALAGFEKAIAQDANNFTAHFYRGAILQERKLWPDSLAAYSRAVAINPSDPVALYNQGIVLKELQQWAPAASSFGRAIALNPEFILAYSNRGEVLEQLNRITEAKTDYDHSIKLYDRAIALNARDATTYNKRALLLQRLSRYHEALVDYDAGVALSPTDAEIWFNRGTALKDLDDLDSALESYERAIALKPDYAGAHLNRGVTLQGIGDLEAAIACYKRSIDINPNLPEARYNLALASLASGDYAAGWSGYEWRWHAKSGPIFRERREFREPLWLGKDAIAGKTILLYAEQGLGDALQFCRYVELVAALGARVILEVPAPLTAVCAQLPGTALVIPFGSALPAFDFQCPLMSLPLAFGTRLDTIPCSAGYLSCDSDAISLWQRRLGPRTVPRIGLTWSGNRSAGTDRNRHFALSELVPYLSQDFQYFCLQTDVSNADQETLEMAADIFQFPDSELNFSNTAALCQCMDLVVSVDTSIAHLSGALGKKTWVLLPFVADWRWLTKREDSPWYRSARLFRQKSHGEWNDVFARVITEMLTHFTR